MQFYIQLLSLSTCILRVARSLARCLSRRAIRTRRYQHSNETLTRSMNSGTITPFIKHREKLRRCDRMEDLRKSIFFCLLLSARDCIDAPSDLYIKRSLTWNSYPITFRRTHDYEIESMACVPFINIRGCQSSYVARCIAVKCTLALVSLPSSRRRTLRFFQKNKIAQTIIKIFLHKDKRKREREWCAHVTQKVCTCGELMHATYAHADSFYCDKRVEDDSL